METLIIGQGYNIQEDTSVAKELIAQFNSKRYDSFTCLVAFASYGGISALTPYILDAKNRGMSIKIILGVDQKGTSKEALEEVLSWGVDAKIYHTGSASIFHPKIYLFENIDIFTLIVGSNNLTEMGLVKNVECSLLVKDIKSNDVLGKFYQYWKSILEGTEEALASITQELIDDLYEDGVVVSEKLRAARYDNGEDEPLSSGTHKKREFNKVPLQSNPEGFRPKQVKRQVKVKQVEKEVSLSIGEQVLIAEIGKGNRWKQVNFPIKIFEDFFGAKRGDNSYKIELMNVSKDGRLSDVEIRQAVTVKSNNFRFEINCAETEMEYPKNGDRPIGLFVKLDSSEFIYTVLMPGDEVYERIKNYLNVEAKPRRVTDLKRVIVDVEAIHALYPEFVI